MEVLQFVATLDAFLLLARRQLEVYLKRRFRAVKDDGNIAAALRQVELTTTHVHVSDG